MALQLINISPDNAEVLAPYSNIRERDMIGRRALFIAEGKVVLSVLLRAARFKAESLLLAENRLPAMLPLLRETRPQCPVYCAPQALLDKIAGFPVHRGILAIGRRAANPSFEEFLDRLPENALLVVLNSIANHDNMGSVFRNAAAFAADGIVLDNLCCDPLYRKSIRVSVGAALKVPYVQAGAISEIMAALQAKGWQVLALSGQGRVNLADMRRGRKTALLLGSEGEGLPPEILQAAQTVRIPIAADFDSLNIATACGIALAHFADPARLR